MSAQRYCFTLDLQDDPALIEEYEQYHRAVWPEILASIRGAGVVDMEIYRVGTRMFMIMETEPGFRLEAKAAADAANPKVQEWEKLMWRYQKALPTARPGEKWMRLEKIFDLKASGPSNHRPQ
jgi:L-rhamnose mutarotase